MITLTHSATEKIKYLQAEDELQSLLQGKGIGNGPPLRIAVRPGGCSGFSYDMYFDFKGVQEDDWTEDFEGVMVVVDPESALKLEGTILDYQESLQGAGFKFTNPSAFRTCGCGESFS